MHRSLARLAAAAVARPPLTAPIPTAPYTTEPLAGTGASVASWLLVHTPVPPHAWPAKFSPANFPLLAALERDVFEPAAKRHAELLGEEGIDSAQAADRLEPSWLLAWDKQAAASSSAPPPSSLMDQLGTLRIDWRIPGRAPYSFTYPPANAAADQLVPPIASLPKATAADANEVYVCTHGERDCRCADVGGVLADELVKEIEKEGLEGRVKVFEVSHLGGHKYAANALCFPSHNLLGNLRPSHAPLLVKSLASQPLSPTSAAPDKLLPLWRGVSGLKKAELVSLHEAAVVASSSGIAPPWSTAPIEPNAEEGRAVEEVELVFRSWEGEEAAFDARVGETLMDLGKRLELGAIEGVCGGVLECATCHCYLPEEPSPAPVEEVSDAEEDMLYTAMERTEDSRLGCQIKVTKELADWCAKGGRIGLPRY